jgi:hypothetical protein
MVALALWRASSVDQQGRLTGRRTWLLALRPAVSGILPVANGGTNSATAGAARTALAAAGLADQNHFTAPEVVKGADIASATTLVIGTDGNYFDVTGNRARGHDGAAGTLFMLQFDSALTITHGSGITLPGAANITTVAGDRLIGFATAANTVDVVAYTRASGKALVPSIFSAAYNSGGQTITSAGTLTLAHGLGAVPAIVQCRLICGTTDLGYSVNDEVYVDFGPLSNTTSRGASVVPDATNLNIRFGSDSFAFSLLNKGTGTVGNAANSSWTIRFLAYV